MTVCLMRRCVPLAASLNSRTIWKPVALSLPLVNFAKRLPVTSPVYGPLQSRSCRGSTRSGPMSNRPALEPPLPWLSDSLRYSAFTPLISYESTRPPDGVSTTRVVLFFSSMQFSWPNAVTTFAPLAAVAVPLAKPSPSPSARRHLAKINGFIAANGSWTAYNGQARRCLAKRDAQ